MQNRRCFNCTHYAAGQICKAFPKGIPEKIMIGKNKHLIPIKGQKNKIVFEQK